MTKRHSDERDSLRCPLCFMHRDLCICDFSPRIITKTRWELIFHISEIHSSTWTGRLIPLALMNTGIHIRGMMENFSNQSLEKLLSKNKENLSYYESKSSDFNYNFNKLLDSESTYPEKITNLILYPEKDAVSFYDYVEKAIESDPETKFRVLIPDGNWNQASRMVKREKIFTDARKIENTASVFIKPSPVHRMRNFLREDHVATIEAVIHILPFLEKDGEALAEQLSQYYERMVKAVRSSRGR
jgi:DTW domain-containing protein